MVTVYDDSSENSIFLNVKSYVELLLALGVLLVAWVQKGNVEV